MKETSPQSEQIAKVISTLTYPVLLIFLAMLYVNNHYADNRAEFWQWTLIGTLLLIVPGTLYTVWLWYRDKHIDIDLSQRHERIIPLMMASVGALIAGALVHGRSTSTNVELMSYILVALLICLTIITLVWKISLHITTSTALISLLMYFRGIEVAYFYLLLIPIAWSRLVLKQHTPAQLLGGALIGATVTLVLASIVSKY